MNTFTPKQVMEAHQYLYYVKSSPAITDYQYDMFCARHNLPGGGGSDLESSYAAEIKELARMIKAGKHPALT